MSATGSSRAPRWHESPNNPTADTVICMMSTAGDMNSFGRYQFPLQSSPLTGSPSLFSTPLQPLHIPLHSPTNPMARRRRKRNPNNNNHNKGSVISIHPVLRAAYGRGARSLRDTLLSLLPPPPQHLLLPDDPPSYSRLLTHAQCAVSSAAPPLPPGRCSAPPHLSQKQIVRNTVQLMRCDRTCHNNLLCKNYDVHSCTSLSVELLSTSDWSLLLNRIGDKLMEYLLRHCSIFVPNGKNIKELIQVTGIPLTSIDMSKTSRALSERPHVSAPLQSGCTHTLSDKFQRVAQPNIRTPLKRKRDEAIKDVSSNSNASKLHRRNRLHSWQRRKQQHMLNNQNNQNKACGQHVHTACFRCFMLYSAHDLPADMLIKRQYIFYNKWPSPALLPKKHVLNMLKANDCGAFSLIKKIFGKSNGNIVQCARCGHHDQSRSKCMYHSTLALFKSLIRHAQRCRSKMLLHRHCHVEKRSLSKSKMHQNKNKANASTISPQPFSKHREVVSFIFASLRRIVPLPLMGNKRSWRMLTKNISKFVQLRRHEKFILRDCIEGLEFSDYEFFSDLEKSCSCGTGERQIMLVKKLFRAWIYWLFFHIIMPIISSNFYVTEKESGRYEVFYYKKPIWGCAVKGFIDKMKLQSFCAMDADYVRNIFNDRRCLGFSRVRFLPKDNNCLRTLASLNKPSSLPFLNKTYKSVNSALSELHVILKTIKIQNPNSIGSSVFDYNDVYQRLHGFISRLNLSAVSSMPEIFIVVADVSKAFDSIDQDKLLQIMERIMRDDEYTVGNYRNVLSRNNSVRKFLSLGSVRWHGEEKDASDAFVQFSSSSGVFVAQAVHKKRKKCDLHRLLTEHVKHNVVKIGHNLYEQKVGITQGSIVSSLLCSFYLGHLEETIINPYLEKLEEPGNNNKTQGNLLMRYLDDFIFVSTSKKQAIGFLERLRRGFRDYNCYMNCEKFRVNFEIEGNDFTNVRYVGDDGVPFLPWSGLLVNCITLEIQADYTRYWDINIRSTITVHKSNNNPCDLLQRKLFMYLLPKSYIILYDSNINSPATVRLNVYQAFLLCAMKFHCYIREMMHLSVPNPNRLLKMIKRTCRYMYNLICKRVRDAAVCFSIHAAHNLKAREVIWLGLYAFHRILNKKQSRYRDLLPLLRENIEKHDILKSMPYDVRYAVDDSHSSMFWKINY